MQSPVTHICVRWIHENADEPVLLYSELDEGRWEVRKVEVFRDGTQGFASVLENNVRSFLGEVPVPPLEDIDADPQFVTSLISAVEFEEVWAGRKATTKPRL